jgi:beta-glucosidase
MASLTFPTGFVWGVATSAYQIEGAWDEDGRGESIWDRFSHTPYRIKTGANGDQACDHFHRMPQDVELLRSLNLPAYRFSIAWPRILPEGRGTVNSKGLDFYDGLVDRLLQARIKPCATLYHWDLPQKLMDQGGWVNRDCTDWYTEYARTVFDRLGDRVEMWITHNEPWVASFLGYKHGIHAPGIWDTTAAFQVAHHLLLSHGKTVQLFRQGSYPGKIGITLNMQHFLPASQSEADRLACQRVFEENTSWFLEPVFLGRYPPMLWEWIDPYQPHIKAGDMQLIAQPLDFLGENYYNTNLVSFDINTSYLRAREEPYSAPGWGQTEMGWGINPAGLTAVLLKVKAIVGDLPIFITENGTSLVDEADETGYVNDTGRINYLRAHLAAAHAAIQAGINLCGYFCWSLMDNFEWSEGYGPRFGLVRVDYDTFDRIPKQSAYWYSQVIANNAVDV